MAPKKNKSSAATRLHNDGGDLDMTSGQIQYKAGVSVDLCHESSSTLTSAAAEQSRSCWARRTCGLVQLTATDMMTHLSSSSSSSSSAGLRAEHTDLMSAVFPPQKKVRGHSQSACSGFTVCLKALQRDEHQLTHELQPSSSESFSDILRDKIRPNSTIRRINCEALILFFVN